MADRALPDDVEAARRSVLEWPSPNQSLWRQTFEARVDALIATAARSSEVAELRAIIALTRNEDGHYEDCHDSMEKVGVDCFEFCRRARALTPVQEPADG